ncbi:hypothetical protein MAR_033694, partial [Mya arenaria]
EGCQAPIEKGNDALYRNGATYTVSHESCSGGNIPSFKGQITCVNGRWSEQVSCLGGASYRITVKTANIKWSTGEGTDREVYLYMYGSKGNSSKIILHGRFEAGYNDITVGHFVDVGEINKIRIGVKALHSRFAGWKLESVLIEDVSKNGHTLYLDSSNCAKGYIPNSSSTKCTATGWTINVVCNQIFCSPPAVLRNVHPFYLDGHTLYLDSSNCAKGYIPNSSSTKCTATGWTINVVCNQIFCTPPAGLRNVHSFYLDGHTLFLDSSNCAKGYIPNSSSTKCTATGWTINVVCNQRKSTSTYRIRVKTIDYDKDPWGGTRQNVLIEKIHLKAYGNVHVGEKWKPDYVTIHVEDTDDLYVFRYKSSEYLFKNETSLYPEGKCSRPFANYRQEIDVYGYYLQRKPAKDEIDCKIQCIEHIQCKMSVYETNSGYCRGYFYGKTRHYSRSTWTAYDLMPCYGRN